MKRFFPLIFIVITLLYACKSTNQSASDKDILFSIGGEPVTVGEFEYVYKKNNFNTEIINTREDIKEYLDLYINFKLKVREARTRGYDTTQAFIQEFDMYKNELVRPYLSETKAIDTLCREAYERMHWEVKAAHILIRLPENPLPDDTLKAYEKISGIRQRVIAGEDFEELAKEYSEDPSARTNGGMLGHFTAFQMVYPFETAAYSTSPGHISKIIRTQFGYHILKVFDKRPSRGKVKVAHILIRVQPDQSNEYEARDKIFEIHDQLIAGVDWDALCNQFSEDNRTRYSGGSLPYLSTGQIDETFVEVAFNLNKPGEISDPFQTRFGWHILKLENKKGIDSYDQMKNEIESKVRRDSRGLSTKKALMKKLEKESHFKVNNIALEHALTHSDERLLQGKWTFLEEQKSLDDTLISFDDRYRSIADFFRWVEANQRPVRQNDTKVYMNSLFDQFVEKTVMQYEVDKLISSDMEFKMLLNEYYEGILLFDIMEREVWTRATTDTSGLRSYYEAHKELFRRGESADVEIFNTDDEALRRKIRDTELDKDQYVIGETEIRDYTAIPEGCAGVMKKMQNLEDGYIILAGNEQKNGVMLDSISKYLVKNGIEKANIKTKHTEDHPNSVLLSINSKSKKSLELLYNTKSALTLQVDQGKYEKGDHPLVDSVVWQPGLYDIDRDNRYYLIRIKSILSPEQMTFDEARGKIITRYQDDLEKNWIEALKSKYIVELNHQALNKTYRDLEKLAINDH